MLEPICFGIDFDGTCVTHDFPDIGKEIGSQKVLQRLLDKGHKLILYTMRSGTHLNDAVKWFKDNNLELFGVQYHPSQYTWTASNKCYANHYIDDAALGIPLKTDLEISKRPFVDWEKIEQMLEELGLI